MKKFKILTLLLLAASLSAITSCQKDGDSSDEETASNYPVKIVYKSNYNSVSSTVNLYEFVYNDKKELKTVKYYNADSIYSITSYDGTGRLTKLGTTKNPNAIKIEYNLTGDVSKVTESFKGPNGLIENYRTFEYSNTQITKTNYYHGSNTVYRSVTYGTNAAGNLNTAQYAVGTSQSGNVATVSYDSKLNPLYNIKLNPAMAFLPEGLWTNIEFILFSKNLIKEFAYTGDGTRAYSYEFDSKNRVSKILVGSPNSTAINQTYEISYLD